MKKLCTLLLFACLAWGVSAQDKDESGSDRECPDLIWVVNTGGKTEFCLSMHDDGGGELSYHFLSLSIVQEGCVPGPSSVFYLDISVENCLVTDDDEALSSSITSVPFTYDASSDSWTCDPTNASFRFFLKVLPWGHLL